MFPKPEPLRRERARARREHAVARAKCVAAVWVRDAATCRACRRTVYPAHQLSTLVGHVHEVTPRSVGGDATDPVNCLLLCGGCHALVHAHRLRLPLLFL